jgi:hypothetical protein
MNCPVCGTTALAEAELEENLTGLRCASCQGVWIPSVRYKSWMDRHGGNPPEKGAGAGAPMRPRGFEKVRPCPECGALLARYEVGRGGLRRAEADQGVAGEASEKGLADRVPKRLAVFPAEAAGNPKSETMRKIEMKRNREYAKQSVAIVAALLLTVGFIAGCHMGPKGPFCQSCAMPMDKPELFGTEANGTPAADYCTYCYQKGVFTDPGITLEQMIDKCAGLMVEQKIMPEDKARALMTKYLPQMKRWKTK